MDLGPSKRQQEVEQARKAAEEAANGPDVYVPVPGKPGWEQSQHGRQRYNPFNDPGWIADQQKRIRTSGDWGGDWYFGIVPG